MLQHTPWKFLNLTEECRRPSKVGPGDGGGFYPATDTAVNHSVPLMNSTAKVITATSASDTHISSSMQYLHCRFFAYVIGSDNHYPVRYF